MPDLSRIVLVGTSAGNAFMNEILGLVAHEISEHGVEASVVLDAFEETDDGTVFVFIPHEHRATTDDRARPTRPQLARTIAFCVEQPGTEWFELSSRVAATAGAVFDISRVAAGELQARGTPAEHFRIGYSRYWDRWLRDESIERLTDVIHLGTEEPRRLRALASYASTLARHRTRILLPPVAPKPQERPDFLTSSAKWLALRDSKVLLNIHRQELGYFEWIRVLEAVCNGCVVVSESSRDSAPLVAGEHFLAGRVETLGLLADSLLRNPERAAELRLAAYDYARETLSMRSQAGRLLDVAQELASGRRKHRRRRVRRSSRPMRESVGSRLTSAARRVVAPAVVSELRALRAELRQEQRHSRAGAKAMMLRHLELSRQLRGMELRIAGIDPGEVDDVARTPAYDWTAPRVSVIVPLFNHASEVAATLRSVAASDHRRLEVVILDDGSSDRSREVASSFLDEHPGLPARLLSHRVNQGLGRTRTTLAGAARGELVFALDADNEVYPTALRRLEAALDGAPEAVFAYSTLEVHADGTPESLMCHQPWDPERFREDNYIDAMAMIRRDALLHLGGYSDDLRLHGWEDYDLWCRVAEAGMSGVHVPEILGRYRRAPNSMISLTNLDTSDARRLLKMSYPRLMGTDSRSTAELVT